jgi:hypothetical protein
MARYKGVTYQRKGNDKKSYQNIPKAFTPPTKDLSVDLGSWILDAKVLVQVLDLIKIPSQRDKLLKAIKGPKERILGKCKERSFEKSKEYHEDVVRQLA